MDDLTAEEFSWLMEGHIEAKKEHYNLISYAFRVGYVSAKTGKSMDLFRNDNPEPQTTNTRKTNVITLEEREKELKIIDEIFG